MLYYIINFDDSFTILFILEEIKDFDERLQYILQKVKRILMKNNKKFLNNSIYDKDDIR